MRAERFLIAGGQMTQEVSALEHGSARAIAKRHLAGGRGGGYNSRRIPGRIPGEFRGRSTNYKVSRR
jgi:hypothetical protein